MPLPFVLGSFELRDLLPGRRNGERPVWEDTSGVGRTDVLWWEGEAGGS